MTRPFVHRLLLPLFFLVVLASLLAIDFPSLNGGPIFDDNILVFENPNLRSFPGLIETWTNPRANQDYYPLTLTSWWIEYQLFDQSFSLFGHDLRYVPYHLTNIILHALNATLLLILLQRLRLPILACLFASLLFAFHPVNVESVAWMSQRKNTLSGCLYLLCALSFLKAISYQPSASIQNPEPGIHHPESKSPKPTADGLSSFGRFDVSTFRRFSYVLSILLFIAAMLAKPLTMTLAATLPLLTVIAHPRLPPPLFSRRTAWPTARAILLPALPFLLLCIPMARLTMWVQEHHVGAVGEVFHLSLMQRLILAPRVVCFYLGKLLFPADLSFAYPRWTLNPSDPAAWLYPAIFLALLAAAVIPMLISMRRAGAASKTAPSEAAPDERFQRNRKEDAGPLVTRHPSFVTSNSHASCLRAFVPLCLLASFIINLSPALGFIDIYWHKYNYVADHIHYMPSIAILVFIALLAARIAGPVVRSARWLITSLACLALVCVLAVASRAQAVIFLDDMAMWSDAYRQNPDSAIVNINLGKAWADRNRRDLALPLTIKAVELDPNLAEARYSLGYLLLHLNQPVEALPHLRFAVDRLPKRPEAHFNLALALSLTGEMDKAIESARRGLAIETDRPIPASAYYNLAKWLQDTSGPRDPAHLQEAVNLYRQAIDIDPAYAAAWFNLGLALRDLDRPADARDAWQHASDLDHSTARNSPGQLARLLLNQSSSTQPATAPGH